jgi:hypothetical protein
MSIRNIALVVATAATCILLPSDAGAQNCGDWYRPLVCTADLVLTDTDRRTDQLNDGDRVELGPRDTVEIEVEARDQRGSRFPADRLTLSYDEYDCRSMLRVEDEGEGRLRISASAAEGRCRLELWMPNNLNFQWELEVEISAAARSGYERAEAELVATALYAAILNREPDSGGLSSAVAEIQSGNLDAQIAAMTRSDEFRQGINLKAPPEILEQFYRGILERSGDSAGVRLYLSEVQRGQYASVLSKLIRSPEFERRLQQ